jgi:hypothetical protein
MRSTRFIPHVLLPLLISAVPAYTFEPLPRPVPPPPQPTPGKYVGVITVIEKIPTLPSAVPVPNATPKDELTQRRTERITASVHGARIRLLGQPGSNVLGSLDEPNFATIELTATYIPGSSIVAGTLAEARKGVGDYAFNADRVRLTFLLPAAHKDFTAGDQTVSGEMHVRIDLTRVRP